MNKDINLHCSYSDSIMKFVSKETLQTGTTRITNDTFEFSCNFNTKDIQKDKDDFLKKTDELFANNLLSIKNRIETLADFANVSHILII